MIPGIDWFHQTFFILTASVIHLPGHRRYGQRFNNRPITTNRVKKKCITCLSSSCWASSLDCLITSRLCRRCLEKGRLLEGQSIFIRAFEKQNTSQINSSSLKTLRELGARLGMYEKRHENALQNLSATVDKTRQRTVCLFFMFPTGRNVITEVRSSVTASGRCLVCSEPLLRQDNAVTFIFPLFLVLFR